MENFDLTPIENFMNECQVKLNILLEKMHKEFDTTEYKYTNRIDDLKTKVSNLEMDSKEYLRQWKQDKETISNLKSKVSYLESQLVKAKELLAAND